MASSSMGQATLVHKTKPPLCSILAPGPALCLTMKNLSQALHTGPSAHLLQAGFQLPSASRDTNTPGPPPAPGPSRDHNASAMVGPSLPLSLKPELAPNPREAEQLLRDNMVVKTSPLLHLGPQPHVAGFASLGVGGPSPGLGICRHTTVTVSHWDGSLSSIC